MRCPSCGLTEIRIPDRVEELDSACLSGGSGTTQFLSEKVERAGKTL